MADDKEPECVKCKSKTTSIWSKSENGEVCNECMIADAVKEKEALVSVPKPPAPPEPSTGPKLATRKSTRTTRNYKTRLNPYALPKPPKGKGRRIIFKKSTTKAPSAVVTTVTSDYVFYKGSYIQVGDIVSMRDEDGDIYYAQIRGLLQDQYCEKSAVVTWLLPTRVSPHPEKGFDPSTYILGPEEDIPRKLNCMEFIMHAPSEYFKAKNSPYPTVNSRGEGCFIWTRLPIYDRKTEKEGEQAS
ncbi:GATA zinc finger domain-containing protein 1 [Ischnura elegans]|uniref:GATA zinc finger domain-containing protein 1 n=1 Tax=Ischnura elegans TaxID=197161 RepID=UPI001ED88207|nr:GATA zinc finger domain-containing protein 1 [Ischnura elegans]